MKVGSLFAGIGGLDLGFEMAGMETVWQVEIDKFCVKVLEDKWPNVLRLEDVKDVGKENLPAVDLICGGFPCQDLSVAGRREGLAGERSGLWWEFLRIIREIKPEWVVIENVPGLLSSYSGENPPGDLEEGEEWETTQESDMGIVLQGLEECGYWWAYRVLDLQHFGVPQRRRRVFIVASLGDRRPEAVLFEPESSPWDPAPGREAGEGVTPDAKGGFAASGKGWWREGVGPITHHEQKGERSVVATVGALQARDFKGVGSQYVDEGKVIVDPECLTPWDHESKRIHPEDGVAPTLAGSDGQGGQRMPCISFRTNQTGAQGPIHSKDVTDSLAQDHPPAVAYDLRNSAESEQAQTLQGGGQGEGRGRCINAIPHVAIPINTMAATRPESSEQNRQTFGVGEDGDPMFTLQEAHCHAVAFTQNTRDEVRLQGGDGQRAGAPLEKPGMKGQDYIAQVQWASGGGQVENDSAQSLRAGAEHNYQFARIGYGVRRLTPTECERLQGFPDGWTAVEQENGKPMSDSARYRMLGNAVAVPVAEWIGYRLMNEEERCRA